MLKSRTAHAKLLRHFVNARNALGHCEYLRAKLSEATVFLLERFSARHGIGRLASAQFQKKQLDIAFLYFVMMHFRRIMLECKNVHYLGKFLDLACVDYFVKRQTEPFKLLLVPFFHIEIHPVIAVAFLCGMICAGRFGREKDERILFCIARNSVYNEIRRFFYEQKKTAANTVRSVHNEIRIVRIIISN